MKNLILKFIGLAFLSIIYSFFDSFLPFIPPVTTTFGGIGVLFNPIFYIPIIGFCISLGTILALALYRRLTSKIQKISSSPTFLRWKLRISTIIDDLGYFIIIPLQATSLGSVVNYSFLFAEKVEWMKFFLYTILGRTLALALFSAFSYAKEDRLLILGIIGLLYFGLFLITFILLFIRNDVIVKILIDERQLNRELGVIPPSRFRLLNKFRNLNHKFFNILYYHLVFKKNKMTKKKSSE